MSVWKELIRGRYAYPGYVFAVEEAARGSSGQRSQACRSEQGESTSTPGMGNQLSQPLARKQPPFRASACIRITEILITLFFSCLFSRLLVGYRIASPWPSSRPSMAGKISPLIRSNRSWRRSYDGNVSSTEMSFPTHRRVLQTSPILPGRS